MLNAMQKILHEKKQLYHNSYQLDTSMPEGRNGIFWRGIYF